MPGEKTSHPPLIEWSNEIHSLGVASVDSAHAAFIDLLNRLHRADDLEFPGLFRELLTHLESHFQEEETMMLLCAFPAIGEHMGEHRRVLGEIAQISMRVDQGLVAFGRGYVRDRLPDWFRLHTATMDSALAAHWKRHQTETPPDKPAG